MTPASTRLGCPSARERSRPSCLLMFSTQRANLMMGAAPHRTSLPTPCDGRHAPHAAPEHSSATGWLLGCSAARRHTWRPAPDAHPHDARAMLGDQPGPGRIASLARPTRSPASSPLLLPLSAPHHLCPLPARTSPVLDLQADAWPTGWASEALSCTLHSGRYT